MAKFFHLLYYYLLALVVLFMLYMTTMLALAPKIDEQKRGFIPCTEQLVLSVSACNRGEMMCPLKHLWQDMKCNTSVILEGFGAWVRGKQNSPWANYLFKPEISVLDGEGYDGDIVADMADLEAQSQFINRKKQELDEAKNRSLNLREDVLMSAPESVHPNDVKEDVEYAPEDEQTEQGDITDEAFMEEIEEKKENE